MVAPGVQGLAYAMQVRLREPAAMVIPLPVARDAQFALTFIDLKREAQLFEDIEHLFEFPMHNELGLDAMHASPLFVHRVGSFIASYVPTMHDFARVDSRFRIPSSVLEALPHYRQYGFVVFQLAGGRQAPHPMAMMFPTQTPEFLYFPTVHVHDGAFHNEAEFDHMLYYQHPSVRTAKDVDNDEWYVSRRLPRKDYGGLIDTSRVILRDQLLGRLTNLDTWVPITSSRDQRSSDHRDQPTDRL